MNRIAIHSVPRSGSTWLGEIFNSNPEVIYKYQPLFSYAFKGRLNPESTKDEILRFFDEIAVAKDEFLDQTTARKSGKMPIFEKSTTPATIVYKEVRYHHILHNMMKYDDEIKVVGLIRNPLAVIRSWLNAPREFRRDLGWNELEEWRNAKKKNENRPEEFYGFEKWKEVAMLFESLKQQYPDRFFIVHYKKLLIDPRLVTRQLFEFAGLFMNEQTDKFIIDSSSRDHDDAYSVYRQKEKDDLWSGELPRNMINTIQEESIRSGLGKYLE